MIIELKKYNSATYRAQEYEAVVLVINRSMGQSGSGTMVAVRMREVGDRAKE